MEDLRKDNQDEPATKDGVIDWVSLYTVNVEPSKKVKDPKEVEKEHDKCGNSKIKVELDENNV